MEKIVIKPRYPVDPKFINPEDTVYTLLAYQIDDRHAVTTDGFLVTLSEIVPVEGCPGTFTEEWSVNVAVDDERTLAGLERIVERLKSISGYELLIKHYNAQWDTFFTNRPKTYISEYDHGSSADPVNKNGGRDGKDY